MRPIKLILLAAMLLAVAPAMSQWQRAPLAFAGAPSASGWTSPSPTPPGGVHLLNNLVAYWILGESADPRLDSSGNGHTLSDSGTVGTGSGPGGGSAVSFGASDTGVLTGSLSGAGGGTAFTVSMWEYPENYEYPYIEEPVRLTGGGSADFGVLVEGGGGWLDGYYSGAYLGGYGLSAAHYSLNTWCHFVIVFHAGTFSLYMNGALLCTHSSAGTISSFNLAYIPGAGNYQYTGRVSNVGIWNRALTSAEVSTLYGGGAPPAFSTFTE